MATEELGIILDVTPGDGEQLEKGLLEGMGHPVLVCHGPGEEHDCPILHNDDCPMLDAAHGIVFQLDLDRAPHRAILARYKEIVREGMPLGVAVRPGQEETYADLLHGVHVWTHSPTAGELDGFAATVEAADDMMES
jgi:hypothetical protein